MSLIDLYNYLPDAQPVGNGQFRAQLAENFNDPQGMLASLRALDPNAQLTFLPGHDNGEGFTPAAYELVFDRTKLPRPAGYDPQMAQSDIKTASGTVGNTGNYDGWNSMRQVETARSGLYNPSATHADANYGALTSPQNAKPPKVDLLDVLGPAAVTLIGTILSGGALAPLQAAGMSAFNTAGRALTGQGFDPISAILGAVSPFSPLPSYANAAIRAGVGVARGGTINPTSLVPIALRSIVGRGGDGGGP